MALPMIDDDLLALLRGVDTPTVCNAIEVVQGKRGFAGFTRGTMVASHPAAPAMVGFAVTAKLAGLAPPNEPADVIRARRMDYYRMMAEAPRPPSPSSRTSTSPAASPPTGARSTPPSTRASASPAR